MLAPLIEAGVGKQQLSPVDRVGLLLDTYVLAMAARRTPPPLAA